MTEPRPPAAVPRGYGNVAARSRSGCFETGDWNSGTAWPAPAWPARRCATWPNWPASGSRWSVLAPPPLISRAVSNGFAGRRGSASAGCRWWSTTAAFRSCPDASVIPTSPRACSACACAGSVMIGRPTGAISCWRSRALWMRAGIAAQATLLARTAPPYSRRAAPRPAAARFGRARGEPRRPLSVPCWRTGFAPELLAHLARFALWPRSVPSPALRTGLRLRRYVDGCQKFTQRQLKALGCQRDQAGRYAAPSDSTFLRVLARLDAAQMERERTGTASVKSWCRQMTVAAALARLRRGTRGCPPTPTLGSDTDAPSLTPPGHQQPSASCDSPRAEICCAGLRHAASPAQMLPTVSHRLRFPSPRADEVGPLCDMVEFWGCKSRESGLISLSKYAATERTHHYEAGNTGRTES